MRAPETESVGGLVTDLLHSSTNMHLKHFMTTSYSQHIALQEYYEKIVDLTNRLVETIQGYRGEILTDYTPSVNSFGVRDDPEQTLKRLRSRISVSRDMFGEDGAIQAIVDDILELLDTTIYKLFAFTR